MSNDVTDADKVCAHDVFEHLLASDPEGTRRAVETIANHRTQSVAALQAENEKLREERDNAIRQAQQWKMEAQCHKSTVHEAYQHVTGASGEPGNWNGAEPIIAALSHGEGSK